MTAKIKLNAASGGGSFSIQAPSSSSNNRVISSPDIADGTLLTSQSSLDSTKLSPAISAGITMADQWRITSAFQVSSQAFITSNWERNDSTGYDKIGTGMSESSGVFSFPSTGIYLVRIVINWYASGGGSNYLRVSIHHTTNNSSYYISNFSYSGVANNNQNNNMMADTIFDVTDVSTHKIKFETLGSNTNPYVAGNSTYSLSYATFIRLGDT